MRSKLALSAAAAAVMALAISSGANAASILVNGDFESSTYLTSSQFGSGFGGQGVTGWTGGSGLQEWFIGGTQNSLPAANQWGDTKDYFWTSTTSPNGGDFVALDGDSFVPGQISQGLSNLKVGKTYTLTFDWAAGQLHNRTGDITEKLQVSFGGQTHNTSVLSVPSRQFSGWQQVKMLFTPTAANQTLSFLSIGTPGGLPPMALLDGVSLTVPEPATWGMMIFGLGGIGLMMRRKNRGLVTA